MAEAALSTLQSFKPLSKIHQNLSGFHCYATDRSRAVLSHHYCSCAPGGTSTKGTVRQCVIYDSNEPDARLIGIEYVVDEAVFKELDEEEKKYWHSHKYEVESGLLIATMKGAVPSAADDAAEQAVMKELQQTYGKTFHMWQVDKHSFPLGPPQLMMSFTGAAQLSPIAITHRDTLESVSTQHKQELRSSYLDLDYKVVDGADAWEKTGKGIELKVVEKEIKEGVSMMYGSQAGEKNGAKEFPLF